MSSTERKEPTLSDPSGGPWNVCQGAPDKKPLDHQVGGSHYKSLKIQPLEYIHANNMPYCEANVIKYITRWKSKNGLQDLEKVKHYVDLLIQLEGLKK